MAIVHLPAAYGLAHECVGGKDLYLSINITSPTEACQSRQDRDGGRWQERT